MVLCLTFFPVAGLKQQVQVIMGRGLTAKLPYPSRFTCLHTRLPWPPSFGRPGVYQLVSKVTLEAAAGTTCNYAASLDNWHRVSRAFLFYLF